MSGGPISVEPRATANYVQSMGFDDEMRDRLIAAIEADTRGKRGGPRTPAQLAEEMAPVLKTDPISLADQLRRYTKRETGLHMERRIELARVLGKSVLWLLGGTRHLSGNGTGVPVIDSRGYPVNATPEARHDALLKAADGAEKENQSEDPNAHWVYLRDTFGDYRAGDSVLVSPAMEVRLKNDCAAIADSRFVIGKIMQVHDEDCLLVLPSSIYTPGSYDVIGGISHHLQDKRNR